VEQPQQNKDIYVGVEFILKCSKKASNDPVPLHCMHDTLVCNMYMHCVHALTDLRVKNRGVLESIVG